MNSERVRAFFMALSIGLTVWAGASEAVRDSDRDPIGALLAYPAPVPGDPRDAAQVSAAPSPAQPEPPGEDAPPEVLAEYWAARSELLDREKPSEIVRKRLIDACDKEPARLPALLPLLLDAPETHDRVKRLLDAHSDSLGRQWRDDVGTWLRRRSRWLRDELVSKARAVRDEPGGWVAGEEDLAALARLDWARAAPLLRAKAAGRHPRAAALAWALLHEHAAQVGDAARERRSRLRLQAIVADRKAPGWARDHACDALLRAPWPGRDDWYLSLFSDATLRDLFDGNQGFSPLLAPVANEPERWIPIMTALVGHADRAVHDAAVSCLVQFQLQGARPDALRPLLPWLRDPAWSSARDRLRLIQSLGETKLPESVPGLIWAAENDPEDGDRAYAAEALAEYQDARAIPALRRALAKEPTEFHRSLILKGLLACGGVDDAEAAGAVETYARQTATPAGREAVDRAAMSLSDGGRLSVEVSLGAYLSRLGRPTAETVARLLDRVAALETERPDVGRRLREIVEAWPGTAIDRAICDRLLAGRADAGTMRAALMRRDGVRRNAADELRTLLDRGGALRGLAVVLLGDGTLEGQVLQGSDREAQRGLLAGARLVREPLPISRVADLLAVADPTLALAAERYLASEDSPEARQRIRERALGQALILGARPNWDPGHSTFPVFDRWEDVLRAEVRAKDGPDEVLALLSAGYWGGPWPDRHPRARRAGLAVSP